MAVSAGELTTDVAQESALSAPVAGKSPTQIALSRLRSDKVAVACVAILSLMVILALLAPLITKWMGIYWDLGDPKAPDPAQVLDFDGYPAIGPPFHGFTWSHPLGLAPASGADNLAYLLYGLRTSLFVATVASVFTVILGVVLGLLGGFSRGWLDRLLTFTTDFFLAFPFLLAMLAIYPVIVSIWGKNVDILGTIQLIALIVVLVVFDWMVIARLIRGQVLSLREREFVLAAEVIGVPTRRILFKELLPNLVAPIVIATSLLMPSFVAAEAVLSYLGFGLTGIPSLGKMISDAQTYYSDYPLYLWVPVGTIALLTLCLNLLGDSIRDAFDPKTRR